MKIVYSVMAPTDHSFSIPISPSSLIDSKRKVQTQLAVKFICAEVFKIKPRMKELYVLTYSRIGLPHLCNQTYLIFRLQSFGSGFSLFVYFQATVFHLCLEARHTKASMTTLGTPMMRQLPLNRRKRKIFCILKTP